jgi:L-arabinokinase
VLVNFKYAEFSPVLNLQLAISPLQYAIPVITYYISGHGLGHSSRSIEVMRAIRRLDPDREILVRTAAPRWLFDSAAPEGVAYQSLVTDTGVVQHDSLSMDEEATARAAAAFDRNFHALVESEAQKLRDAGATVVVGDVPALAFAAAARAGVPSVAIANFTWDWIFSIYPAFERIAETAIDTIRRSYAQTTIALRLPLHGGFATMPTIRDIPLIARKSTRDSADTRRRLGVPLDRTLVLASFSGFGLDLPVAELQRSNDFVLMVTEREPPPGLRYEDLVAAADVVVSKPGYGIVSECAANQTALLYTSRGNFVEYDVLVAGMPQLLRSRFISPDDLRAGRWSDAIRALLAQPHPPDDLRVDGATVAAGAVLDIG